MSEKIIVLVSDRGDSNHGEISVLDDPQKAEKLVETLLEAGFEQERIRVFAGRQSDFQVSQRPVVALVAEGEQGGPQVDMSGQEAAAGEPPPAAEETEAGAGEPPPSAEETEAGAGQEGESETEEVPASAETAAPVKFSSLFRSA